MERLLTLYSEVQSTDVRWLWYPFIAIGKITLLQGDPGDGKSTMMMNLIAELSTGGKTPDGCKIGAPQKVIYQCSEDGVWVRSQRITEIAALPTFQNITKRLFHRELHGLHILWHPAKRSAGCRIL